MIGRNARRRFREPGWLAAVIAAAVMLPAPTARAASSGTSALVRNHPEYVAIGLTFFAIQAAAIGLLLVQRGRLTQARTALRESESLYRTLVASIPEGILILDGARCQFVNEAGMRMLGAQRPDDLVGHDIYRVMPESFRETAQELIRSVLEDGRRLEQSAVLLKRLDGGDVLVEGIGSPVDIGGRRCVLASLRDVTSQRRAEVERDRFFNVSLDVLCIAGLDGYFKRVNPSFERVLGYSSAELTSRQFIELVHPDDREQTLEALAGLGHGIDASGFENRYICADGSVRWLQWSCPAAAPGETLLFAAARDVTPQKTAEDAARVSQSRLRQVIDLVPNFIFAKDRDGRFILVNRAVADAYGCSIEELTGKTDADFARSAEEAAQFRRDDLEVIESGQSKLIPQERITDAAGRVRLLQTIKIPYSEAESASRAVLGVATDVTELAQTMEALRESEERLRLALHSADMGMWDWDVATGRGRVTAENQRIFGLPETSLEPTAADYAQLIHPDDWDRVNREFFAAAEGRAPYDVEYRIRRANDGAERWVHSVGGLVTMLDSRSRFFGVSHDVTERKRTEERLNESEQRLRLALDASGAGAWAWDAVTGQSTWDDRFHDMYGFSSGEPRTHERWLSGLHPDDRTRLVARIEEILRSAHDNLWQMEFRAILPGNRIAWMLGLGRAERDARGRVVRISGINLDVSEAKQAGQLLRESEQRLQLAATAAGFGTYDADLTSGAQYWSPEMRAILGLAADAPTPPVGTPPEFVHPNDRKRLRHRMDAAINPRGSGDFEDEYRVIRPDGSIRWVLVKGSTLFSTDDEQRRPLRATGIVVDITERKRAEEALLREKRLFERGPVVAFRWRAEAGWPVEFVSENVAQLGYRPEDLTSGRLRYVDLVHPDDLARVSAEVRTHSEAGERCFEQEYRLRSANGAYVPLYDFTNVIRDNNGRITHYEGYVMDISARRAAEEASRASEEKYRLLIDITDTGFVIIDGEGRVLDANENYVRQTGRQSVEEIRGHSVQEWTAEYDLARNTEEVSKCATTGHVRGLEIDYRRSDGAITPIEINASVIHVSEGPRIVALCRDISERRQAAEELRRAHAELEQRVEIRTAELRAANAALEAEVLERRRAEERLRTLAEEYSDLYNHAPCGYHSLDAAGRFVRVNDTELQWLGYERGDIEGRRAFRDLLTEPSKAAFDESFTALMKAGSASELEFEMVRSDGTVLPVMLSATTARDRSGTFISSRSTVFDITERRRAEAAIRESERFARAVVDALTAHLAILDSDGTIIGINRAWREFGEAHAADPKSVGVGANYLEVCSAATNGRAASDAGKFADGVRAVLRGERAAFEMEYECHGAGERRWFVGRVTRFPGVGPDRVVVAHEEVTDRKISESALRRQAEILGQIHDAVVVMDMGGVITEWNAGATRIYGYAASEAIGRHVTFLHFSEDAGQLHDQVLGPLMRVGTSETELRRRNKSGDEIFVQSSMSLLRDEVGERIGLIGYSVDITARRRAEERLKRYVAEMTHVDRLSMMGQMASALAHEINQPLAAITNYLTGCLRRFERPAISLDELGDALRKAAAQAHRAGEIIRRMRDFTKKRDPRLSTISLNEIVREACRFAEHEAAERGVRFSLRLDEELPNFFLDRIQIGQVLLNLIRNGVDAMQELSPSRRELTIVTCRIDQGDAEIRVHDCGSGLRQEVLSRLFEPFFSTKPEGMGIGLSISRSIIEAHGGRLSGASAPGGGAVFTVRLPIPTAEEGSRMRSASRPVSGRTVP